MMLHQQHVIWIYAPSVQLIKKDHCQLIVESMGPSLRPKGPTPSGGSCLLFIFCVKSCLYCLYSFWFILKSFSGYSNNLPTRQTAPKVEIACAVVLSDGTLRPIQMSKEGENFKSTSPFSLSLLQNEDSAETTTKIQIEVTIPKDYFTLNTLMDTNLEKPSIIPEAQRLLELVLKGEKSPGWDWIITVGEEQSKEFFVHGPVLAHSSPLLEVRKTRHFSVFF